MSDDPNRRATESALATMRARGLTVPMDIDQRRNWQDRFNALAAMRVFGATLDLTDPQLIRVALTDVHSHHQGGLGTDAINGAVIAALFDCAIGVAGSLQFPGQACGTIELSIKMLRRVPGPVDVWAIAQRRAQQLAFVEAELFSANRLCGTASGLAAVANGIRGERLFGDEIGPE